MTSMTRGLAALLSACLLLAASASSALAAGYDTPILYSARHMGMGGTAIGYVNDPSAVFHNPAGFAHVKKAATLLDISFLTGHIQAVPSDKWEGYNDGVNGGVTSEPVLAPAFLVGGAYRINDMITAGFGLYPLASAGGGYKYNNVLFTGADPTPVQDSTKLVLIEASPVLAFNLPGNLNLGIGYRFGLAMLDRDKSKVDSDEPAMLGLSTSGTNIEGFRVGLQWSPAMVEGLQMGLTYRNGIKAIMTGEANLGATDIPEVETSLALAPKLGAGLRYELGDYAAAFDAEYTWSSWEDGEVQEIVGQMYVDGVDEAIGEKTLRNVMLWQDGLTLRGGLEMRFAGHCFARAGYIYDAKVGNEVFPSAFGTPPAPTQTFTVGTGYSPGPWSVNLAYAMRQGGVTITPEDAAKQGDATLTNGDSAPKCDTCGYPGDYEIVLHGIYVDFSYEWGDEEPVAAVIPTEVPAAFEPTPEPAPEPLTEAAPEPAEDASPETATDAPEAPAATPELN